MRKKIYTFLMVLLVISLVILSLTLVYLEENDAPPQLIEEKEILYFRECVTRTGLTLYGRTNSQLFLAQKEELANLFEEIPFVDCLNERERCKGVMLIPAWKVNEQLHYGFFSRDFLIKLIECDYEI